MQMSARQKRGLSAEPAVRTDPKVGFENNLTAVEFSVGDVSIKIKNASNCAHITIG